MSQDHYKINKNIYIQGLHSIVQYEIGQHIFTVMGEFHSLERVPCKYKPISTIENFVVTQLEKPNVKLLMEYPPSMKLVDMNYDSINMIQVKEEILKNKLENKVEGIDIRRRYIYSDKLYNNKIASNMRLSDFLRSFLDPLNKHVSQIFTLKSENYDKSDKEYLQKYIENKYNNLQYFNQKTIPFIQKNIAEEHFSWNTQMKNINLTIEGKTDIITFFRKLWESIADLYILKKVLKSNTNYIVLIGERHADNVFDVFSREHIYKSTRKQDCINLKGVLLPL